MNNILFFGDSLTEGYGLDKVQAPPALIQERINQQLLPYKTTNAGVSGDTTHSALMRLPSLLQSQQVDIMVLALGINDIFRNIPSEQTKSNLSRIIERTKAQYPDVKIILAAIKMPIEFLLKMGTAGQVAAQRVEQYTSIYPELATTYQTSLIPSLLEGVLGQAHLNQADLLHPNAAGYGVVAENIWQTLYPILREKYSNGVIH